MNLTIREQEEIIFKEWLDKYPTAVKDGVVNEDTFENIVFVLKEVNGGENWDLREHLRDGGQGKTWNNIVRWTKGLTRLSENIHWKELESISNEDRKQELLKIAAMNVKKTAGGASSNMEEVDRISVENKKLLQRQMSSYKPKIIVCCGVGNDLFDNIFKDIAWKQTTRGIWYLQNNETILVAYFHPNAHIKSNFLYYGLIDAVKEIQKQQGELQNEKF